MSLTRLSRTIIPSTRQFSTSRPIDMLYIAFCPDNAKAIERRLAVRPSHFAMVEEDKKEGTFIFGRGFLDEQHSHSSSTKLPELDAATPNPGMIGSVMIYRYPTIEDAWKRIKGDPYWAGDVWDKEKVTVRELLPGQADDTMGML